MSQGRTASTPYTIKNGVNPVVRFGVVRSPQSTESSSSTQCVLDSVKEHTNLGIKLDYASVYHPQTNGQVERANGLVMSGIKPRLVRSLRESDKHWVEELDSVLWGLRTMSNRTIGYTPFFMVYGAEAVLPCDIIMTHLECACTKKERPSLIDRTA